MQKSMTTTEQFCLDLLGLPLCRSKAIANFLMGLLSTPNARHPVDAFDSLFCQYTHSNLGKIVEEMSTDETEWEEAAAFIRQFLVTYSPPLRQDNGLSYHAFALDVTKICKPHSPTLEGRQFVPKSNEVIAGNKAIDAGYRLSMLHWQGGAGWPLPWRCRVPAGVEENSVAIGVRDMQLALGELSGILKNDLCVLEADSSYGQAAFLSPLYKEKNLVCTVRLRAGMRVWLPAPGGGPTGGAKRIYGEKYYLRDHTVTKTFRHKPSARHPQGFSVEVKQRSITELYPCEEIIVDGVLQNGRRVLYCIKRWCGVMIRSKNGHNMKDKPFDLLRIEVRDEADEQLIFERPLFIAVSGQRRSDCSNLFVQQRYRERYQVEPFYNYLKHQLLLQRYQTSDRQHLLNYLLLTLLAVWMLWCARQECPLVCKPWQKYLPKNKEAAALGQPKLTLAQTRQSIKTLFYTFDLTPFKPLYYKKGKGRKKGDKLPPKIRHPVQRKPKKMTQNVKRE